MTGRIILEDVETGRFPLLNAVAQLSHADWLRLWTFIHGAWPAVVEIGAPRTPSMNQLLNAIDRERIPDRLAVSDRW